MTTHLTAGLRLALLAAVAGVSLAGVSLAGCSDPEPVQTIEGVSPEQNGTLEPDATVGPGGLAPQQQDPGGTLAPGATLEPGTATGTDTTAAPGPTAAP